MTSGTRDYEWSSMIYQRGSFRRSICLRCRTGGIRYFPLPVLRRRGSTLSLAPDLERTIVCHDLLRLHINRYMLCSSEIKSLPIAQDRRLN